MLFIKRIKPGIAAVTAVVVLMLFSIPAKALDSYAETAKNSDAVTIDIRDADIRDILTSLSVAVKKSIIYTEEPVRLSF